MRNLKDGHIARSRRAGCWRATLECFELLSLVVGLVAAAVVYLISTVVAEEEVLRVRNAGLKLDAVVYTRDAGATTSTIYFVSVVRAGASRASQEPILVAARLGSVKDLAVHWEGSTVAISIPKGAQVFDKLESCTVGGRSVRVHYRRGG